MKVSVVIPVYNVEAYVESALRSVLKQTLQDFEIICVNDASTDNSWNVVRGIAQSDPRIRLYENAVNGGAAATRNTGMTKARGEYLYFLDADDMIVPDALEKLYKKAHESALDVLAFCSSFIYEKRQFEEAFSANPSVFKGTYPDVLSGKELYVLWMKYWDWMPLQQRLFYKRQFLMDHSLRFPPGLLHEDEIFTFDVLMCANRVHVSDEILFLRRFRAGSLMTGAVTARNVEACLKILQHTAASADVRSDPELSKAAAVYRKKLTQETWRKYAAAGFQGDLCPCGRPPFLSVIIPVFCVEKYLPECLESILAQSFIDFELICVDDASTDRSLEILREYREMDPRIRILQNSRNIGQGAARNRGLDCCRGQYIYMMDADDLIAEGTFELLHDFCVRSGPDVIGFENSQFTDDPAFAGEAETVLFSYEGLEGLYTGRDAFVTLVNRDVLSPSVPTYLTKASLIRNSRLRFFEGLPHEDVGYIFEMLIHAGRVQLLHRPLYLRRFRPHSTVTGPFTQKRACGYLMSWKKACDNRLFLEQKYGDDAAFLAAYRKWMRDVLGRIRTLYLSADADASNRPQSMGDAEDIPEEACLLWTMLCETTTGTGRAETILGEEAVLRLEQLQEVYICGFGQYMNRMLDAIGALNVVIKGIIASPEDREKRAAVRGFRVYTPAEIPDRQTAVVLAVSHYNEAPYLSLLKNEGLDHILRVSF